jgi:hypothetical protein
VLLKLLLSLLLLLLLEVLLVLCGSSGSSDGCGGWQRRRELARPALAATGTGATANAAAGERALVYDTWHEPRRLCERGRRRLWAWRSVKGAVQIGFVWARAKRG